MKNGSMLYLSRALGRIARVAVRDCPDPAAARRMLEEELGTPVRWESGGGRPTPGPPLSGTR